MHSALLEAQKAFALNEVPIGAVLVDQSDTIIAGAHNLVETTPSALSHAELLVIQAASTKLNKWRLSDCTLYVTLEPCIMCMAAIRLARIGKVVYGAGDSRYGGAGTMLDLTKDPALGPPPEVISGVLADECSALLKSFFVKQRANREG